MDSIYLDNAATTFPKSENVYKAIDTANRTFAVNAGRGSYKLAQRATEEIDHLRAGLKRITAAPADFEIVLSPSITIALNQVLNGLEYKQGDIVYISPYEHNAVARTFNKISAEKGIIVKLFPVNEDDREIDINRLHDAFTKDKPRYVCCTHVSNVTGYILPVREIFNEAKIVGALTILDSAQSLGLIDVNIKRDFVDILAFAGHKTLYGPFGIGGFIYDKSINITTFITGGTGSDSLNLGMPNERPKKYEAASQNISAIAGLKQAIDELNIDENYRQEKELTHYLVDKLKQIETIQLFVPDNEDNHIAIVSFAVLGYRADDIGMILDQDFDISVRTGYHCAPYVHNLIKDEAYGGTVRVGLGKYNTKADIDALCEALESIIG